MCAADRGDGIANISSAGEDGRREFLGPSDAAHLPPVRFTSARWPRARSARWPPGSRRRVASRLPTILLRGLALVVVGKRRDGQVQKPAVVSLLDTRPVRRHRVARGGANDLGEVGLIGVAPANDLFAIAYVRVRRAEQLSPGRGTPSRLPARSFRPSLFKPTTFERAPARPPFATVPLSPCSPYSKSL